MRTLRAFLLLSIVLGSATACVAAGAAKPTATPLTLPSPTPIAVRVRPSPTLAPTATSSPWPTSTPESTLTPSPTVGGSSSVGVKSGVGVDSSVGDDSRRSPERSDGDRRRLNDALQAAGIDARVYWFASGDEQRLMIQYASPIRNRPGYAERLQTVKTIAAANFLQFGPSLYTLYIAATDITGTSDTVLRLDRYTVERWARGEIGDADFYNNGFVPSRIIIVCTGDECTGVKPTPYPTFPPFPPFPTPTP